MDVTSIATDSSTDPAEVENLPAPVFNKQGLQTLGVKLSNMFGQYKKDRYNAELQWLKNMRQRKGVYDPEILKEIGTRRSKAYPRVTRVKCVGMLSKMMNLLFPASEKNWTLEPSPIPDLTQDDLQTVLDQLNQTQDPNNPVDDDTIEEAIRAFARKRGDNLEKLIEDQLQELGGDKSVSYTTLARLVMKSGIEYGHGTLHGPFAEEQTLRTWQKDQDGKYMAVPVTSMRPRFEFVPIWDYYPDMSAKYFHEMRGQFQRKIMSKHNVIALKQRADIIPEAIDQVLAKYPTGNFTRLSFETELKAMGKQINVNDYTGNDKYEMIMWDGYVSAEDMKAAGVVVPDAMQNSDVKVQVFMFDNIVVKAATDPWTVLLKPGEQIQTYHHFIFEEDEANLLGVGLPEIMRDSQIGICAATRMVLDNGSVQRMFELNTSLLRPDMIDIGSVANDKIWYREDDSPATINTPALKVTEMPMFLTEMQEIVNLFTKFADQETFVNPATGGDMQNGPSEPFRTAAGASMLKGEAALPFKDVVRNYDIFTESVIDAIIKFNKVFNEDTDPNIRGDFRPVARGATSLIAKEVLGIQLDNLAVTLTDEEKQYVNFRELALARVRVRDMQTTDVIVTEAEAKQIDAASQQAQAAAQQQQTELMSANIREALANAFKNVAQANKNTAAADAASANVILKALEVGLNATDIIHKVNGEQSPGDNTQQQGNGGNDLGGNVAGTPTGSPEMQAAAMPTGSVPAAPVGG